MKWIVEKRYLWKEKGKIINQKPVIWEKPVLSFNGMFLLPTIKLLHRALNRNWLTTVDKTIKCPKAKGFCFSYISTSSRIVSKWFMQSAKRMRSWNSGDVAFGLAANKSMKTFWPQNGPRLCKRVHRLGSKTSP